MKILSIRISKYRMEMDDVLKYINRQDKYLFKRKSRYFNNNN